MSLLPAEVSAQLAQLLQELQSADNNVRSQAEEVLQSQWTSQRPEWLLMGLAEQIATSTNPTVGRPARPAQGYCIGADPSRFRPGPSRPSFSAG